jgi:shikimate kinase
VKSHVALIGFMGAGKSTLGKRLALELNVPFVDTDAAIVARHGPIARIFEREGEAAFRQREFEAVLAALDGPPGVLALGGGAVTHGATSARVAERTLRVYLDVPLPVLVRRLSRSRTVRPVLGTTSVAERVEALLAERAPLYREADLVVKAGERSRLVVVREIAELVRARSELRLVS